MKKNIQKYATKGKGRQPKGAITSKTYVSLPKSLNELSRGYKSLVRELGKR